MKVISSDNSQGVRAYSFNGA